MYWIKYRHYPVYVILRNSTKNTIILYVQFIYTNFLKIWFKKIINTSTVLMLPKQISNSAAQNDADSSVNTIIIDFSSGLGVAIALL